MKKLLYAVILAGLILAPASSFAKSDDRDVVYQVSTLSALMEGLYNGEVTIAELKERGNIGIGTFDALDGEMVCKDGKFYQVKGDGSVVRADWGAKTPYAVVAYFDPFSKIDMVEMSSLEDLKSFLDANIPSDNIFYAVKITGTFKYVKTRSVPRQSAPYPRLSQVTQTQPVFEARDIQGTMVGFRSPEYVKGLCAVGYHFHFLSADENFGGHLLECSIAAASAELDDKTEFFMRLPNSEAFMNASLGSSEEEEIVKAEK
jgi:acetolactate decarboxylase